MFHCFDHLKWFFPLWPSYSILFRSVRKIILLRTPWAFKGKLFYLEILFSINTTLPISEKIGTGYKNNYLYYKRFVYFSRLICVCLHVLCVCILSHRTQWQSGVSCQELLKLNSWAAAIWSSLEIKYIKIYIKMIVFQCLKLRQYEHFFLLITV